MTVRVAPDLPALSELRATAPAAVHVGSALLAAWNPAGVPVGAFSRVLARMPDLGSGGTRVTHRTASAWAVLLGARAGEGPPAPARAVLLAGNPTGAGITGADADIARAIATLARRGPEELADRLDPPWAALTADAGLLRVDSDRAGLQHLYERSTGDGTTWISSSLLALAAAGPVELDGDALAEWLAVGHFLTERTLFDGARKLAPGEWFELRAGGARSGGIRPPQGAAAPYREALLGTLAGCGGPGLAAELTGGFDSRLIFAGLRHVGAEPLAWTLGAPGCAELRTVDRLQAAGAFPHVAVNPADALDERLPELVRTMHRLSDGEVNALEYAPLLRAFEVLAPHRRISVSGGGGELGRGFYWRALRQPGRRVAGVPLRPLVGRLTAATGGLHRLLRPTVVTDPDGLVASTVAGLLRRGRHATPHDALDDLYLRGRMQRFAGRNVTTTGLFCRQAAPYLADAVVAAVGAMPRRDRHGGRAMAELLADLSPALAGIPLDSGLPACPGASAWPRRTVALGRKAVLRAAPARLSRHLAPVPVVPWGKLTGTPAVRAMAADLLAPDTRIGAVMDPTDARRVVEEMVVGGPLYPLGLLVTLEATLREIWP